MCCISSSGESRAGALAGVFVQFGGQTALNLAAGLEASGVQILGSTPASIDLAEDRQRFGALLTRLGIPAPAYDLARDEVEALRIAAALGYPVVLRPSYVLGGRAMAIARTEADLRRFIGEAALASPQHPVFIDQFLENAVEVDVDAICDGERVVIGGIMQHVERAGIHSGDSACVMPPFQIDAGDLRTLRSTTQRLGEALQLRGFMNIQFAIRDGEVYVLEVNPRASRTIPFVSKATGLPLAKIAAKVMLGHTLQSQGITTQPTLEGFFVKEAVLPWKKFPGTDTLLGPEMRSTGEVMGHATSFGHAFAKSQEQAGAALPTAGGLLIVVSDRDLPEAQQLARGFVRLGFAIYATRDTADRLACADIPLHRLVEADQSGTGALDAMRAGKIQLIINTPRSTDSEEQGLRIRTVATRMGIPLLTTLPAAAAALHGIESLREREVEIRSLQDYALPAPLS